ATSFRDAVYLSNDIFWVRDISSSSFIVLYKSCFGLLANNMDNASDLPPFDTVLSSMTSNKVIALPFLGLEKTVENYQKYTEAEGLLQENKSTTSKFEKISHLAIRNTSKIDFGFNGDIKAAFTHDSGEDLFIQSSQEEKIIVLVPFFNAAPYLQECF